MGVISLLTLGSAKLNCESVMIKGIGRLYLQEQNIFINKFIVKLPKLHLPSILYNITFVFQTGYVV